ncbi:MULTISPECIES: hypothetical protein [Oceanotoga]|jgi:hypothetical protein|uniref:DinB family protein n=1 Tax=Oceanotoga teriensis TaxID=515440 RepID=A0AA45HHQ7_9BACT|nr:MULTISPECIES: hypothetical protein [Oceanotoga]MDN5341903.1 hypothetical protein [Oceanotoga sp.]MDO7976585.1 hypothetical protein [Oceanotoga teriensis]PWJ88247.1 hypothetical protein C7380_1196 [Oceanotoga teriensis]
MDRKVWNAQLKYLRSIILKKSFFNESIDLCLKLHAMVHSSNISDIGLETFEDDLWKDLDELTFKRAVQKKGRTIAYGIWHSTRIEDITMNILVNNDQQVLVSSGVYERLNSKITDTGNSLSEEEILHFSNEINMIALKEYRDLVGEKTRDIIKKLKFEDFKRKFSEDSLKRIIDEKAVLETEKSVWLIDFWGKKNVAGIILMPATRHNLVHLNESMEAKKRGIK